MVFLALSGLALTEPQVYFAEYYYTEYYTKNYTEYYTEYYTENTD